MEQNITEHLPGSKAPMIAWVHGKLNKPPFPISPQQSLLQNKEPKQPAYYDRKYYKALEWKKFQNWGDLDLQLRTKLIETWHSDSRIEGVSTIGGWNGTHWLGWVDFDLDDFGNRDKITQGDLTEIQKATELMESAIANWIEQFPILKDAPHFTTPSGGHRFLVAWDKEPEKFGANNGFTLNPNSEQRMGELLTRNGGHTLLPPTLGTNGKAYEWVHFAEYPPVVSSPSRIGLYPVSTAKKTPQRPERKLKNNYTQPYNNSPWDAFLEAFSLPTVEAIPLENCLSKEHRELIQTGVGEGARDNTAAAISRDLIGTANYLSSIGQPIEGDPRMLLEQFCLNCSPPLTDSDLNRIYGSAERSNPTPCLSEDKIKSCIAAYVWKRVGKEKFLTKDSYLPQNGLTTKNQADSDINGNGNSSATASSPHSHNINGNGNSSATTSSTHSHNTNGSGNSSATTSSPNSNSKVVNHPSYKPVDDLLTEINQIIEKNLQKSELRIEINYLAQRASIPTHEVWKLYNDCLTEIELEEMRPDTAKELDLLLEANVARIALETILPKELAEPINKLAGWLNLRPEAYLTALLTGISSLHNPQTKVILNSDWGFEVSPNLFSAIVAPSSQKKSPILKAMVTKPMRALHRQAQEDYEGIQSEYNEKINRYEQLKKSKKKEDLEALKEEFPQGKPQEPRQKIYYFTNATGEGIVNQVQAHPDQGLLYLKDELAGVFKSANQYRGGRGSDEEDLLSYYDGTGGTVLRSKGTTADLDGLLLSVLGSTQPLVLQKLLGNGEDSNGNWARFIFINQPHTASEMSQDGGSFDINPLITWLYSLIANLPPQTYRLSKDAFELFCKAYNRLEQKRIAFNTTNPMSHVWGKSEGRIGKLAINLHIIKYIVALGGETGNIIGPIPTEIDRDTFRPLAKVFHDIIKGYLFLILNPIKSTVVR